jgi:hypothetical protein
MSKNVREETANVALSEILEEYGMSSASLVQMQGDIPDIYLVERGVRVIIEMKKEGNRDELIEQIGDRLDEGVCEITFGVIFPSEVTEGGLVAPSTLEVKQSLKDARLEVLVQSMSSEKEITRIEDIGVSELPELISRYAGEALDEEELDEAVERVSDSIDQFVTHLARHPNADSIAEDIEGVLEGVE